MSTSDLPPEGQLIRRARERAIPKISIRAAAARIGISPEHWGNVERGYKSDGNGKPPIHVEAAPELLAKMAAVVHVTADEMERAGRRPDAADILRSATPAPVPQAGNDPYALPATAAMEEAMAPHFAEIQLRVSVARHKYPGRPLSGAMVFGQATLGSVTFAESPPDADSWDFLSARGWPEADIPRGVAYLRALEQERNEGPARAMRGAN